MCGDFLKKFVAQHDDVFMRIARQAVLVSAVVPDPSFAEKIETRAMHHFGIRGQTVRPKENGRAECAFKRGSVLELDRLTFLLDSQRRQEDGNRTIRSCPKGTP